MASLQILVDHDGDSNTTIPSMHTVQLSPTELYLLHRTVLCTTCLHILQRKTLSADMPIDVPEIVSKMIMFDDAELMSIVKQLGVNEQECARVAHFHGRRLAQTDAGHTRLTQIRTLSMLNDQTLIQIKNTATNLTTGDRLKALVTLLFLAPL